MEARIFFLLLSRSAKAGLYLALSMTVVAPVFAAEGDPASGEQSEEFLQVEEPLIQPKVERKEIIDAKIDTEDFELGFFGGLYSTEDFGTNSVMGFRFAYHINEDFFFEFTGGETETEKSSLEQAGFFTLLADNERDLQYYNFIMGFNILPGEAFITRDWAFYTAFYVLAGIGSTSFAGEDRFTIIGGGGFRFIATDWMALHVDFRDHVFEDDTTGVEKTTHNLEIHSGVTFFF